MKDRVNSSTQNPTSVKKIIHKGKPQAFEAKPVPELLHTIYISPRVRNMPHWPARCHTLRISCREIPVQWTAGWTTLMSMLAKKKVLPLLGIKLVYSYS